MAGTGRHSRDPRARPRPAAHGRARPRPAAPGRARPQPGTRTTSATRGTPQPHL